MVFVDYSEKEKQWLIFNSFRIESASCHVGKVSQPATFLMELTAHGTPGELMALLKER